MVPIQPRPEGSTSMEALVSIISAIIAGLSALAAGITIWITQRNEKHRRQIDAFFKSRDYYLSYIDHCIANENLDVFEVSNEIVDASGFTKKEIMIVYLLVLLAERQFTYEKMLRVDETSVEAWKPWLSLWAEKDVFQVMWAMMKPVFSNEDIYTKEFSRMIEDIIIASNKKSELDDIEERLGSS